MKVKVKATFRQLVTYSKEFEMEYTDYLRHGEAISTTTGRKYQEAEAALFNRCDFDPEVDTVSHSDPELDDFQQIIP